MSAVVDATESLQTQPSHQLTAAPELLPLTAERKLLCLEVLEKTGGNLSQAAKLLGTTRQNVHRWLQTDPAFAELFADVMIAGTENLEERYYTRAMEVSDRAAEFLLKARKPDKYREQYKVEVESSSDPTRLAGDLAAVLGVVREAIEAYRVATANQAQLDQHATESSGLRGPAPLSSVVVETTAQVGPVDQSSQSAIDITPTRGSKEREER